MTTTSNITSLQPQGPAAEQKQDGSEGAEVATNPGHIGPMVKSMVARARKTPNYAADKAAIGAMTDAHVEATTDELERSLRQVFEKVAPLITETEFNGKEITDGRK